MSLSFMVYSGKRKRKVIAEEEELEDIIRLLSSYEYAIVRDRAEICLPLQNTHL